MDISSSAIISYFVIGWSVFITLYCLVALGQLSFFACESLRRREYGSALRYAALFVAAALLSWFILPFEKLGISWSADSLFKAFSVSDIAMEGTWSGFVITAGQVLRALLLIGLIVSIIRFIRRSIITKDGWSIAGSVVFSLIFICFAAVILTGVENLFAKIAANGQGVTLTVANCAALISFIVLWIFALGATARAFYKAVARESRSQLILSAVLFFVGLPLLSYVSWLIVPGI
ncbi:MAG: hypothetical protein NC210_07455 [[Clostridium] fimetarium]|nr:hypothetical protein [Alistipes timonensis]MCM1406242.1 hypothetical protein [[Clostridium] fimetarium]